MNNCDIWDGIDNITKEIEMHENYEAFILETAKEFYELDWIIEIINELYNNIIKPVDYFGEMNDLNEDFRIRLLRLFRYAIRAERQYSISIHKFLDDIESFLLSGSNSINMAIFEIYKKQVINKKHTNLHIIK